MASVTIDAALPVMSSPTFPFVFPLDFAPVATAQRLALVDMSMAVTASRSAHFASAIMADASLGATLTPSAALKQHSFAGASLGVTASPASGGDGGTSQEKGNASLALSATLNSQAKLAGLVKGSVAATLTSSSAATRGALGTASQAVTATPSAVAHRNTTAAASLAATLSPAAVVGKKLTCAASLAIRASTLCGTGNVYALDAALVVVTYDTFPYVFPFIFEGSPDKVSIGRIFDATTPITASVTASATRGVVASTSLSATLTQAAVLLVGTEKVAAASLAVNAATTAAATVNHVVGAQLPATVSGTTAVFHGSLLDASAPVTLTAAADTGWDALMAAALGVGAESGPGANVNSTIAVLLPVGLVSAAAGTRGIIIDAQSLAVLLSSAANVIQELFIGAGLNVSASTHAGTPEPMPFFPYFLR